MKYYKLGNCSKQNNKTHYTFNSEEALHRTIRIKFTTMLPNDGSIIENYLLVGVSIPPALPLGLPPTT